MLEPKNHGLLGNHQREKLINVMVYFAQNTQKCGKVKLLQLMYFIDFQLKILILPVIIIPRILNPSHNRFRYIKQRIFP